MRTPIGMWIAACLLLSITSNASANEFDMTGASCIPGDPAVTNNRYLVTGGTVKHKSTNTDLITLYCGIPTTITSPSHIELLYSSTANNATTLVKMQYIKMSKTTGAITSVATANSQSGVNNGTPQLQNVSFSDTYSPSSFIYYVRVDLQRSSSANVVIFYKATVY